MRVIYADTLLLLNTGIDYLLLLSVGKLCALPLRRWRMVLGALWGGVYALAAALWPAVFALWTAKLAVGALAVVIAFGAERRTLRAVLAFYAVASAFGGAVYAAARLRGEPAGAGAPISFPVLLLSFALCYVVVDLAFRHVGRRAERRIHSVEIRVGEREVSFAALADSGNELIDPVTGCAALIVSAETVAPLFAVPEWLATDPTEALERVSAECPHARWRLLPCSCVAGTQMLLCFRADNICVDGRQRKDLLVAISRNSLTSDGTYQAIL